MHKWLLVSQLVMWMLVAIAARADTTREKTYSVADFEKRDGLIYLKGESGPFTGINQDYHLNGSVWFRIRIENGRPVGKPEFWDAQGNRMSSAKNNNRE